MLFSQLTGPLKCNLQGLGVGALGHVARVFVGSMLHPCAARALTTTGSSSAWYVSTVTAIGGGFCTRTSEFSGTAVMFNFTAVPGSALEASAVAMMLLESTLLMASANPETVTVVFEGGLIRTMFACRV